MAETTLNKQLSGTELINSILYDIRTALELDDRFAPYAAYSAFGFSLTLTVRLPGSHVAGEQVERTVVAERGALPAAARKVTVEAERPVQSPNEVRLDTEQPLPVLVRDERDGGTREEWKKVSKGGPPKAGGGGQRTTTTVKA